MDPLIRSERNKNGAKTIGKRTGRSAVTETRRESEWQE